MSINHNAQPCLVRPGRLLSLRNLTALRKLEIIAWEFEIPISLIHQILCTIPSVNNITEIILFPSEEFANVDLDRAGWENIDTMFQGWKSLPRVEVQYAKTDNGTASVVTTWMPYLYSNNCLSV